MLRLPDMSKRFKLKFSLRSLQFCRSKHPSTFPETPIHAIYRPSPVNPKAFDIGYPNLLPAPPPSTPEYVQHPPIRRQPLSKVVSVGCGCRSRSCTHYNTSCAAESRKKQVVAKGRRSEKEKKAKASACNCKSVSSGDSGWFSRDGEEDEEAETEIETETETETLLSSSRSFSNDFCYEFDHSLETIAENTYIGSGGVRKKAKAAPRLKRHVSMNRKGLGIGKSKTVLSPETESPVERASVLRQMIPRTVDGKVRESVAVVKKSKDPYEDFKRSMLEMILEKQMFEAQDLQQLLQCFLSLNSKHYHGVIVEAFSEIWEALFCDH